MSTYTRVYIFEYVFLYNFLNVNMPINVFGNSNSNDKGNKIDTSLFVQKSYLRTIYRETNIEEDIDLKN